MLGGEQPRAAGSHIINAGREQSQAIFLGRAAAPSCGSGEITQNGAQKENAGSFFLHLSSGARAGGAGEPEAKESISRLERPNRRLIDLGIVIITGSLQCGNARGKSHHGTPTITPAEGDSGPAS